MSSQTRSGQGLSEGSWRVQRGGGGGWRDRKGRGEGGNLKGPKPTRSLSQTLGSQLKNRKKKAVHFSLRSWPLTPSTRTPQPTPPACRPCQQGGGEGAERAGPRLAPELSSSPGQGSAGGGGCPTAGPTAGSAASTPPRGPRAPYR